MIANRIPVIIVGGFLGAGKTTLVNNLIRQARGLRLAALVNDFGAMNVDAELIIGVEGNTIALSNGCVCCTIRDDLATACAGLLARPQRPDAVIVELSGVSEPGPVLSTFLETDLRAAFELSCVLVVVDAENWDALEGAANDLTRAQLRTADVVALSKTDLVLPERIDSVTRSIGKLTGGVPFCPAPKGQLPLEAVLETNRTGTQNPALEKPLAHGIRAWIWEETRPLSLPRVEALISDLPAEILRCKGYVHLEEFPGFRFLVQTVGARASLEPVGTWGSTFPETRLTVIGTNDGVCETELRSDLDACVGSMEAAGSPVLRLVQRLAPELLDRQTA